ncbi:MAG: hypothetical protein FWG92_01465 [Leptospirales bacterium]|nr:hypothetical protein [Leptospirales bacterium]
MSRQKETFTERTLKEIRSDKASQPVKKRRNISRIIIVVDILIIAIVFVFLNTRNTKNEYITASANGSGLNMRFSVTNEKDDKTYMFTITLLSATDAEKTWTFEPHLAALKLSHSGDIFHENKFGGKISKISLLPGEARIFTLQIPFEIIDMYLKEKNNVPKRRKTLIDLFFKSEETIRAEAELNLQDKISALISFEHEVKR